MQAKTLLVALFMTLATALPSPAESVAEDVVQGTETNTSGDGVGTDISIMSQKTWQAAGGCKRDWDEDRRCVNQCIGEANSKCVGWKSMTGVITGGCVVTWHTCQCVCEY